MGVVGCSLSGAARGQRALLEADDAVGDVRGVRVDRRHADRREVVREVAPRVELAVLGAVAAALLVGGAPVSGIVELSERVVCDSVRLLYLLTYLPFLQPARESLGFRSVSPFFSVCLRAPSHPSRGLARSATLILG